MTADQIRPIGGRILARPAPEESMRGRLHVPERAARRPLCAEVLAVGPDVQVTAPGRSVVYRAYAGEELALEDGPLLVLAEHDLLLVDG